MLRYLALLLLLIASTTSGCQPRHPQPYPHLTLLVIRYQYTPAQLADIVSAADEWRVKTNYIATFDIRYVDRKPEVLGATDIFVRSISPDDAFVVAKEEYDRKHNHPGELLGLYSYKSHTLFLVMERLILEGKLRSVVLHELGHSLFLGHSVHSDAIMFDWVGEGYRHLTHYDLEAFCQIYGCDANQLVQQGQAR